MKDSIALPIVKQEQQAYFTHRVFVLDGDNWREVSIQGSLYFEQRRLRIARIAAERVMFLTSEFFPVAIFPGSWPPDIVKDFLGPREGYTQLELTGD